MAYVCIVIHFCRGSFVSDARVVEYYLLCQLRDVISIGRL